MLKRTEVESISEPDRTPEPTRRRALRVLGLAGFAGLAGCTGTIEGIDSGDGDESDDTEGGDDGSSEGQVEATDDSEQDDDATTDDESSETESDDQDVDDDLTTDDESTDEESDETEDAEQDRSDPETAELTVRVIDDADAPVEGASLTLIPHLEGVDAPDHPMEHGETDADGVYTDVLEHHEYTIEVEHPGFELGVIEHTHDGPGEVTVPLKLAGDPNTTDVTDVSITVLDTAGEPIEGASIQLIPEISDRPITEGETDVEGIYTEPIVEQVYILEIAHAEYEHYRRAYIHEGATEMTIELGSGGEESSLVITVVDTEGEPITGASVTRTTANDGGNASDLPAESAETDADGEVEFVTDHPDHIVSVEADGYETVEEEISVDGDSEEELTLEPVADEPLFAPGDSVTFTGSGGQVSTFTDEVSLVEGVTTVDFTHEGEGIFDISILPVDGGYRDELLANGTGPIEGRSALPVEAGDYYFDVMAEHGRWSMTVEQPGVTESDVREPPLGVSGSGPDFVGPLALSGETRISGRHEGERTFSVRARSTGHDPEEWTFVFDKPRGAFEGTTTVDGEGLTWLDINADGAWSLQVG